MRCESFVAKVRVHALRSYENMWISSSILHGFPSSCVQNLKISISACALAHFAKFILFKSDKRYIEFVFKFRSRKF